MSDTERQRLEKIIKPIVEGQLRSYAQGHPQLLKAVHWGLKKPGSTPLDSFVSSGSKRITTALLSKETIERLRSAISSGQ